MDSKIIFLGTAGDSTVISQQIRGSGGIIINTEGYQLHIDPGPGSLIRTRQFGINPRNNTAVISTSNTLDVAGGLNEIIYAMSHNGLDKKGVVLGSNSVINGDDNNSPLLNSFYKNCVERFISLEAGQKVGINTIEIRAIKAYNDDPSAFGLKLLTPGFTLSYSGDTKFSEKLYEEYKDSSILILNTVFPMDSEESNFLGMSDVIKILNVVKPRLCILTKFGSKALSADPLYESREIHKQTGVEVIAAKDGMIVNPTNYSSNLIQKTLNLYPPSK